MGAGWLANRPTLSIVLDTAPPRKCSRSREIFLFRRGSGQVTGLAQDAGMGSCSGRKRDSGPSAAGV